MPRYIVTVPLFASVVREVEAKNRFEAVQNALDMGCPTLCHQCAGEVELIDIKETGCSARRAE